MSELSTPLLMWKLHSPIGFRFVPRFSSRKKALLRANSEDLKKDLTLYLICVMPLVIPLAAYYGYCPHWGTQLLTSHSTKTDDQTGVFQVDTAIIERCCS
jgi:hypothetical protein